MRVLVAGGGGFISGHLCRRLLDDGHRVRAVDIKSFDNWWQLHPNADNVQADLRCLEACRVVCSGQEYVYQLAARMGGIGEIELHRCDCAMNVVLSASMLEAARDRGVERFFWSGSACSYHARRQNDPNVTALKEEDVLVDGGYAPEIGYGEEKLFTERLCRYYREDYGLETRVARFHNIFGDRGSWNDGREKAPAALCRKVAEAKLAGRHVIDVWGNGKKTRSFCWIGDCIEGIVRLMESDIREPLNIGSSELVSIEQLICLIEDIAGYKVSRDYDLSKPQGVAGRNSDNTKIKKLLGWEPQTKLVDGLEKTYKWIEQQVRKVVP